MGEIVITVAGSFPTRRGDAHRETATIGGHAAAIGRSIEYLVDMLPAAIEFDHKLHDKGTLPPTKPFGHGPSGK